MPQAPGKCRHNGPIGNIRPFEPYLKGFLPIDNDQRNQCNFKEVVNILKNKFERTIIAKFLKDLASIPINPGCNQADGNAYSSCRPLP